MGASDHQRHVGRVLLAAALLSASPSALGAQQRGQGSDQKPPPEPRTETVVTVTATRLPFTPDEITGSTRTVQAGELRLRPGASLDEALRWMPELSLFRRAPASASHPTTHGLNVRGVAPSGTSRALVLVDGVPLTDAFGGWVQWGRVPTEALDRVEVALGGGAAPLGNQALAGAVQLVTRNAGSAPRWSLHGRAGSDATWQTGGAASWGAGPAGGIAAAHGRGSDGYVGVAPTRRGPIDTALSSRGGGGFLKLVAPGGWRLTADGFAAHRDNGTPLQTNRVEGYGAALALPPAGPGADSGLTGSLFARHSGLDSVFTAVAADRASETRVLDQRVDSTDLGASLSGWRATSPGVHLAFGADARHVRGVSHETAPLAGTTREPGGTQSVAGAWMSGRALPAKASWVVEASLRGDLWRQAPRRSSPSSVTEPTTGPRTGASVSPRLGVLWQAANWSLRASGYGAFRAPTLNELYRQFRVGDVITRANPDLRDERLWGAELGAVWSSRLGASALRVEATGFSNQLEDAVTNATVAVQEGIVLRQRRNLATARVRGLEIDARGRIGRLRVGLGATLLDARILSGPLEDAVGAVAGNELPEVPRWRLTASASWVGRDGLSAVVGLHATGAQFEDDLNRLRLAPGSTLDLAIDWPVGRGLSLGAYGQNILDRRLEVARTPILVLGPPRSLALGLTFSSDIVESGP